MELLLEVLLQVGELSLLLLGRHVLHDGQPPASKPGHPLVLLLLVGRALLLDGLHDGAGVLVDGALRRLVLEGRESNR